MRVGLVLGAGGYVGQAFHLGALSALAEVAGFDGRRAQVLVGTSAGSLVAAGLAGGLSAADLAAELRGEPVSAEGRRVRAASPGHVGGRSPSAGQVGTARALDTTQDGAAQEGAAPVAAGRGPLAPGAVLAAARRPWAVRPGALVSSLLPAGRASTDPIERGVRRLHGLDWPARDLRICAVRARDARRVVFGAPGAPTLDVGTAVAASCAIPSYFSPVRVGGDAYVDGGGHSPTNADVLLPDRLDLVVVLSPMSYGPGGAARPRADMALRFAVRRYLAAEVRRLRRTGTQVVVVQPSPADLDVMGVNPMQAGRVDEVVDTAAASVRTRLQGRPATLALLAQV